MSKSYHPDPDKPEQKKDRLKKPHYGVTESAEEKKGGGSERISP